jgi:hypothetical protein
MSVKLIKTRQLVWFILFNFALTLIQSFVITYAPPSSAAAAGWQVQMMASGKKETYSTWPTSARLSKFASPGTTSFPTATETSTGATSRTTIGLGEGVYAAFFRQTGITKVAFVDTSTTSLDPTAHTNYLIFDLVESTGSESFYAILKRLDNYMSTATNFANNDTVWGSASVLNHTAGTNGYSGTLSASGGSAFKTSTGGSKVAATPSKFAVWGINRDSDNDQQTLVAYTGDLNVGKGDSWRMDDPYETFWSYWGHDMHSNTQSQRIGSSFQTTPGVPTGASWTSDVYLLAYSTPNDVATTTNQPTTSSTPTKSSTTDLSVVVSAEGKVTFFANNKYIPGCRSIPTASLTATCKWKPPVHGTVTIKAVLTPTQPNYLQSTSPPLTTNVERRTIKR